jgi:RimJ/RimL family protein N-acetyltransferase
MTSFPELPRPFPRREFHVGGSVRLEPLDLEHVADLWDAATDSEQTWAYLRYGPFPSERALAAHVAELSARSNQPFFAVIPLAAGKAAGWLSYCDLEPANAALEIGSIWFSPRLQRTRAATEAVYLLMRHAFDDLGYKRVVWRCNGSNIASSKAAQRFGFTFEGTWRSAYVSKGQRQDWKWYSMLDFEWPARRDAFELWLSDSNFAVSGVALTKLGSQTSAH